MLPLLNGYDLLRELRRRNIWTPVLMLTAKDGEYDQTDAFDLGANDYLTKPLHFLILIARLRALVRRGAPRAALVDHCRVAGARSVAAPRGALWHAGNADRREYGLLPYLMRNAGDLVSKTQILDNVWDSAYAGGDNVVEVYIGYLRKKLDAPFGLQTLHTVRGLGYRLDADTVAPAS